MAEDAGKRGCVDAPGKEVPSRKTGTGIAGSGRKLAGVLALCGLLAAAGCSSTYPVAEDETVFDGLERGIRGEALKVALVIALGGALAIAATR